MNTAILKNRVAQLRNQWFRAARRVRLFRRYTTLGKTANILLAETERLLGRTVCCSLPYFFNIDPANVCNLKCPLCPTGTGTGALKPTIMTCEQFVRIIDRLRPWALGVYVYKWGEPFLHPDILRMISYAHAQGMATLTSSNLNVLPRGGAGALVASGLDDLVVSCDGLTQATYEKYRVSGSLESVKKNIREIAACKKSVNSSTPRIELQFLAFEHNEHEINDVFSAGLAWGADLVRVINPILDRTGKSSIRAAKDPRFVRSEYVKHSCTRKSAPRKPADNNRMKKRCWWPWRAMIVNSDLSIDPCCYHGGSRHFGSIFSGSLHEIWNGPSFRRARQSISGMPVPGGCDKIICDTCHLAL